MKTGTQTLHLSAGFSLFSAGFVNLENVERFDGSGYLIHIGDAGLLEGINFKITTSG